MYSSLLGTNYGNGIILSFRHWKSFV